MAWVEKMAHGSLDPNSAGQDIPPKSPVTDQAEPGVFERCRLVVLKKEMPDPGECITLDEPHRNEPPPSRDHGSDEQRGGNARAGEVQSPAGAVGVLAEVKGIEVAESPKRILVVHWHSPKLCDSLGCSNDTGGRHHKMRTSAIQFLRLRARRESRSSPSKLAAARRSRDGSTFSNVLTLTTA